jgi:hypothetical protein
MRRGVRSIPVCCLWSQLRLIRQRRPLCAVVLVIFVVGRPGRGRMVRRQRRSRSVRRLPLIPNRRIGRSLQYFVNVGRYLVLVERSIHFLETRQVVMLRFQNILPVLGRHVARPRPARCAFTDVIGRLSFPCWILFWQAQRRQTGRSETQHSNKSSRGRVFLATVRTSKSQSGLFSANRS